MSQFLAVGLFEYDSCRAEWRADATCAAMLEWDAELLARGLAPAELLAGLQSRTAPPEGLLPAPGTVWEAWRQGADGQLRCLQFQRREAGGVMLDVTAQRRHEAELWQGEAFKRSVMVCSVDCIKLIDLEGRLEYMNPGGLMVMEIDDFIPFQGRPWAELWPEGQRHEVVTAIEAARQGGIGRFTGLAPTAKGTRRWWDVVVTPILDDDQRPMKFLSISRDVSETVRAREALDELNRNLEERIEARSRELVALEEELRQAQKMEAIGQLTGGIAHDFNNLLTGIIGSLDLLQRRLQRGEPQDVDRYINAAISSAQRAGALTQRLLAFSRRQALDLKPVDVNQMVASLEDLLCRTTGENIRVVTELAPDLLPACMDVNQLESALINLVINARDAMPEGGRITVSTSSFHLDSNADAQRHGFTQNDYILLRVSDTGAGMTPEVMARAFEPFYTTKPIGQGTGLGLSMVYGYIKQAKGYVDIQSQPGSGTSVYLYLPVYKGEGAHPAAKVAAAAEGTGETILVVEDEPVVRSLVVEVLTELGYQTLEAGDANEALTITESPQRIDLLVSDVGLPGMNGRQMAEIVRQQRPGLKILFATGYAENAAAGNFVGLGMAVITKPFDMESFATRVREMLET